MFYVSYNCGTDHVFIDRFLLIFTKGIFRSCDSVFAVVVVVQFVDEMWRCACVRL